MNLSTTVRVYRFDVRAGLPDAVVDEIRRAHVLRNAMVEVERRHAERVAAVWGAHSGLADAVATTEAAESRVAAATDAIAEWRKRTRQRGAPATLRDELRDARVARRHARQVLRDAKSAAYAEVKPAMVAARNARKAELKALYRPAVDGGLYWATFNLVRQTHETAVRQIAAKRRDGKPANLRFHRWTGDGTIAVQLQRSSDQETSRSPRVLSSPSSPWWNVLGFRDLPDEATWAGMTNRERRRHARHGVTTLRWRIGSGEYAEIVELPIAVGRPIPDDAEIVEAKLTRRLVGGKERAQVALTCRVAAVPRRVEGRTVAVHTGWRSLPDGALRVAVVAGAAPPPASLLDDGIVVPLAGGLWEVRIPASWRNVHERGAKLASTRSGAFNAARDTAVAWLAGQSEPPVPAHEVARWQSPGRLARLVIDLRGVDDPVVTELEAWRRQDHHLWQWQSHERDQLIARRLDAFRRVAKWVTTDAVEVRLDEWHAGELRRRADLTEVDGYAAEAGRHNAQLAAPGVLRAQIARAADAHGVTVTKLPTPAVHADCGASLDASRSHLVCCKCGVTVDVDVTVVTTMRAVQ